MRQEKMANHIKDLTGQKIGNLYIIEMVKREGEHTYWRCLCDCGEEIIRTVRYITSCQKKGQTLSCGCEGDKKRREGHKKYFDNKAPKDRGINIIFNHYKYRAKTQKVPFTLTLDHLKNIVSENCYYCDAPPGNIKKGRYSYYEDEAQAYSGVDKQIPGLGYIPGNVVACCNICNWAKSENSPEEFIKHLYKIKNHLN